MTAPVKSTAKRLPSLRGKPASSSILPAFDRVVGELLVIIDRRIGQHGELLGDRVHRREGQPLIDVLRDALAIDGRQQRLADQRLVERFAGDVDVERQPLGGVDLDLAHLEGVLGLGLLDGSADLRQRRPQHVDLAAIERVLLLLHVGNEHGDDRIEIGLRLVPVVFVAREGDAAALLPLDELVRTHADRRAIGGIGRNVGAVIDVLGHQREDFLVEALQRRRLRLLQSGRRRYWHPAFRRDRYSAAPSPGRCCTWRRRSA